MALRGGAISNLPSSFIIFFNSWNFRTSIIQIVGDMARRLSFELPCRGIMMLCGLQEDYVFLMFFSLEDEFVTAFA
jgi:hypothetical protein